MKVRVGLVSVMPVKSNGANSSEKKAPPSPCSWAVSFRRWNMAGGVSPISFSAASELMISAPSTSSLPYTWSALACVLTSVRMWAAAGTARRIASSISRVSFRSDSVSISITSSPSTIRPALLQHQEPFGWI